MRLVSNQVYDPYQAALWHSLIIDPTATGGENPAHLQNQLHLAFGVTFGRPSNALNGGDYLRRWLRRQITQCVISAHN